MVFLHQLPENLREFVEERPDIFSLRDTPEGVEVLGAGKSLTPEIIGDMASWEYDSRLHQLAKKIANWDKRSVVTLNNTIIRFAEVGKEMLERGFTKDPVLLEEYGVNITRLPSCPIPPDSRRREGDSRPIWAVDQRGNALVGEKWEIIPLRKLLKNRGKRKKKYIVLYLG